MEQALPFPLLSTSLSQTPLTLYPRQITAARQESQRLERKKKEERQETLLRTRLSFVLHKECKQKTSFADMESLNFFSHTLSSLSEIPHGSILSRQTAPTSVALSYELFPAPDKKN